MNTEVVYRPDGPFLEQVRPPSSRHWQLDGDRLAVGRDPSSAIYVNDDSVSWHHAELVRRGPSWSIVDARSTNGTFVNEQRASEAVLHADDRIRLGHIELIVKQPGPGPQGRPAGAGPAGAVSYDVGWQQGNISNIAGNQANYYHESNLRYIASRRGRARLLIVWGLLLFLGGQGLGLFEVLKFDNTIFSSINSSSFNPPQLPAQLIPLVGLAAFMSLLGIGLFIFGLIARSGAKKEARRLGAEW
jgi:pSer/pThr/pTyr-binding forkhead associated (FHA) protein